MKNLQKGGTALIVSVVVGLIIIIGIIYYFVNHHNAAYTAQKPATTATATTTPKDPRAGWKLYQNTTLGFEIKYPLTSTIEENTHYGANILGTNETQFAVSYPLKATPTTASSTDHIVFTVTPLSSAPAKTADDLLAYYKKNLSSSYVVKKIDAAADRGVIYYIPVAATKSTPASCKSISVQVIHGNSLFKLPAAAGFLFGSFASRPELPKTEQDCGNYIRATYNFDYRGILGTFRLVK